MPFAADPATGYALSGNDPVAYFIDHDAVPGKLAFEFRWQGAVWVFVNEGNRAAFVADPAVYAPQFSGCDPYSLAEGYATTGNALIFALFRQRLFLFYSEVNRFLFLANPDVLLAAAAQQADQLGCSLK
ncbi:twin-arginine translocation pathway signal protein [Stappia sp. F7233]|uniref:Twin-arginine translocation pathway signal protein n=1 Tax=Stappia albiluteola TaxID=2758565 RepID=A0A839ABZ9_9HYPH|nr:twin-arginine translocation pathway signal protein [Stappia albiluteola]